MNIIREYIGNLNDSQKINGYRSTKPQETKIGKLSQKDEEI
jgi:hypothetical protein